VSLGAQPISVRAKSRALLGFGVYRGGEVPATAHFCRSTHIVVSGNVRLSRGEVCTMLAACGREPCCSPTSSVAQHALAAGVAVVREAPPRSLGRRTWTCIFERQPIGIVRINGESYQTLVASTA